MFNFSTRRVGGIRFVKLGRFCFSFCITRQYTPLNRAAQALNAAAAALNGRG
jgi:hypothetical protein